jgi:pyridoxine 4-dehydrogenase
VFCYVSQLRLSGVKNVRMELAVSFRFNDGTEVRRFGYGAMRLTGQPGNFGPYGAWDEGKKVLRRALELGINFIDTARAYGPGWNERLIAEALYPYPEGLFIATKGGVVKKSATERHLDGSPDGLRRDCEESLKNLRVECIDLYQLHWVDPAVPLSESVQGLARLQKEGKIRLIGLSNITVEQLEEARSIAQIASVQNRYSVGERQGDPMVDRCAREGIAFVPYGPLGADPMKQGAPLASTEGALANVGKSLGATATQVALSWLLHRAPNILLIPGTTSMVHLTENVAATKLNLTQERLQELQAWSGL